jgi:hypothetical protein
MKSTFYSQAYQDKFVANMLKFKRDGYCVDIGSYHSEDTNNSFYFQDLDWFCLSVELDSSLNDSYSNRKKGLHLNDNALEIDYNQVFEECEFPNIIDYLSLDVDTYSTDVLKILPFDKYKFKIITIEHDAYLYGDKYRLKQRKILENNGYYLLCSNVLVPYSHPSTGEKFLNEKSPFEDWWIYPEEFERPLIESLKCDMKHPEEIIEKF